MSYFGDTIEKKIVLVNCYHWQLRLTVMTETEIETESHKELLTCTKYVRTYNISKTDKFNFGSM